MFPEQQANMVLIYKEIIYDPHFAKQKWKVKAFLALRFMSKVQNYVV